LVEGRADRRLVGRLGEPLARPSRLAERVGPGAAKLQNLGAMDEALATVEDQVRLVLAPAAQRRRPLLRAAQVEDLMARLDDRAIQNPGDDGGDLAGGNRDHGLVEQRDTGRHLAQLDQRLSATEPSK